jgi:hypothetical protein
MFLSTAAESVIAQPKYEMYLDVLAADLVSCSVVVKDTSMNAKDKQSGMLKNDFIMRI